MPNKCDCIARLKRIEMVMDRRFSVFGVKFGADAILGLVPVVGDVIAGGVGLYLILEARRVGARKWTMVRMLFNWLIDVTLGAIPLVGDIFDIAFRSNSKNVKLLIGDLERRASDLREINREHQLRAA